MLSSQINRIVRGAVRAPDAVIEDACQSAWDRLLRHQHRVHRDKALSWLVATALHEALKLVDRAGRELSLEAVVEQGTDVAALRVSRPPQKLAEDRERLASLASLPPRQQMALWLYGVGLSYAEIARRQGSTTRAVERQLHRARRTLRAADDPASSARLARLAPARTAAARTAARRAAAPPTGRTAAAR